MACAQHARGERRMKRVEPRGLCSIDRAHRWWQKAVARSVSQPRSNTRERKEKKKKGHASGWSERCCGTVAQRQVMAMPIWQVDGAYSTPLLTEYRRQLKYSAVDIIPGNEFRAVLLPVEPLSLAKLDGTAWSLFREARNAHFRPCSGVERS